MIGVMSIGLVPIEDRSTPAAYGSITFTKLNSVSTSRRMLILIHRDAPSADLRNELWSHAESPSRTPDGARMRMRLGYPGDGVSERSLPRVWTSCFRCLRSTEKGETS